MTDPLESDAISHRVVKRLKGEFWGAVDRMARPIAWAINYTGPLAAIVKPVPVVLMVLAVFAPAWGYVVWLNVAIEVGEPWNYGIFAAYISVSWVVMPAMGAVVGYALQRARDMTSE